MIIPDLNLLVYAFNASAKEHRAAARWWEGLLNSSVIVGVPWIVYLGFCRLMTGRHVLKAPYSSEEVARMTGEWFERPNVRLLEASEVTRGIFVELVRERDLKGGMIMDGAIAALAIEHRATLHSNDSDFSRFPELRVESPL